jgi:hypothetical protein
MKKMLSVKVESSLLDQLKQIADLESRSQGGQIEFWIKKEAERLNLKVPTKEETDAEGQ